MLCISTRELCHMRASVIIPVWNGWKYLPSCLEALLAQDYPDVEIIAVDNASTDGSADRVAERYPQVRLIRNKQNRGFAGGCNVGLQAARGDMLVLLNQDTVVQSGWLRALAEALRRPDVGVVGCKILYADGRTIQHAGGWIEWPLGLTHHYGRGEEDTGQWNTPRPVDYVTGAALAFRRDVLERVGPLDEGFWPGYFEDTDFCLRVRQAGYEIWYVPDAVVLHAETTSIVDRESLRLAYQRGRLRLVLKHLPPQRLLAEFVGAEAAWQPAAIRGGESVALRLAYLEAIPVAAALLARRGEERAVILAVVAALRQLHQLAWEETRKWLEASATPPGGDLVSAIPPLEEFEFRSTVPVIGPLIGRFRSLWFNVAARWAIRYLAQQQDQINRSLARQQEQIAQRLAQQQAVLVAEQGLLAEEMVRLILQLRDGVEDGASGQR